MPSAALNNVTLMMVRHASQPLQDSSDGICRARRSRICTSLPIAALTPDLATVGLLSSVLGRCCASATKKYSCNMRDPDELCSRGTAVTHKDMANVFADKAGRRHLAQGILHLVKVGVPVEVVAHELGKERLEDVGGAGQQDAACCLHDDPVCVNQIRVLSLIDRLLEQPGKEGHEERHAERPLQPFLAHCTQDKYPVYSMDCPLRLNHMSWCDCHCGAGNC